MIEKRDNYEIQKEYARGLFLKLDRTEIPKIFDLEEDESYMYLNFTGKRFRIGKADGKVETTRPDQTIREGNFNEVLSIYDILCNPNGRPVLSGKWSPIGNLTTMQNATAAVGSDLFKPYGNRFSGKCDLLRKACEELGGTPAPMGDVAYILPLFDFLPVYLRFWEADDEFPAQLQLLWDENTCRYFRYETTFYAANALMERILQIVNPT